MIGEAVAVVRRRGGQWLRTTITGDEGLRSHELATPDDPGLHGPRSIVWRVHSDSAMLIGGLRALLLQTLHPLAMAGVADHSDYRHDPWGRLNRTGRFVGATTYGNTATAEQSIAMVTRVHERVAGTAPDGRPYRANDPHLLLWVHLTEVDSFLKAYDRFGNGKLRDSERDQYVAEMAEVALRLGSERPPMSVAEMEAAIEGFRGECEAGRQARDAVRFLIAPPVSIWIRGSYGIITAAAITLLPTWARRQLWLPVPPLVEPLAVRPAALAFSRTIGWLMNAHSSRSMTDERMMS